MGKGEVQIILKVENVLKFLTVLKLCMVVKQIPLPRMLLEVKENWARYGLDSATDAIGYDFWVHTELTLDVLEALERGEHITAILPIPTYKERKGNEGAYISGANLQDLL